MILLQNNHRLLDSVLTVPSNNQGEKECWVLGVMRKGVDGVEGGWGGGGGGEERERWGGDMEKKSSNLDIKITFVTH